MPRTRKNIVRYIRDSDFVNDHRSGLIAKAHAAHALSIETDYHQRNEWKNNSTIKPKTQFFLNQFEKKKLLRGFPFLNNRYYRLPCVFLLSKRWMMVRYYTTSSFIDWIKMAAIRLFVTPELIFLKENKNWRSFFDF